MFQKSILKKYLAQLPAASVRAAWERFTDYFHNPERQRNIRALKEEQYQGEFLEKLFGSIFGYTLNPDPGFNLLREQKNVTNAKSADGAILKDQKVFAVIELKDTNTRDLTRVEEQAFGYKDSHRGVRYVVISNFERLRFYIDNRLDFIEFDLFTLTESEFTLLYFCLSVGSLLNDAPLYAHQETVSAEESITKRLYGDYSRFKRLLFADLCERNADRGLDRLLLFRKTQKLLDRLIFIFFCEDRGLLPANSIAQIIKTWREQSIWTPRPLYDQFRTFFNFVNAGQPQLGIFAYNGGLFAPDELLDSLKIDDELLAEHTQKLSAYDFESEVDVNILGHIFEHSLTEIEEIKNAGTFKGPLPEGAGERSETGGVTETALPTPPGADAPPPSMRGALNKRKRDGVFYTPPYITRFIVENTLGTLCARKKAELGISDETYAASETFTSAQRRKLEETLFAYRDWLLDLKICDPACGSGAFLVAALNFLLEEHRRIDAWYARLHYGKDSSRGQSALILTDLDQSILERNLYGVDINEESVEIARLSLWLHTCKPGRKLNSLTQNIKCGNSLLDAEFDWKTEFPFDGFDVVIGNPPYVQLQTMGPMSDVYARCGYECFNRRADLYCLFYERGVQLLKDGGVLGFIVSNKWLKANYGEELRNFIVTKTNPILLVDFPGVRIFPDATVDPQILILKKEPYQKKTFACLYDTDSSDVAGFVAENKVETCFTKEPWRVIPSGKAKILAKMNAFTPLKDLPFEICRGILTGLDEAFYISEEKKNALIAEDIKSAELIKPVLFGHSVKAWTCPPEEYLINPHNGIKEKHIPPVNIDEYHAIKKHLEPFYDKLSKRTDKGETPYNLRNCAYLENFSKPKIIYPEVTKYRPFMYDESGIMVNKTCFILVQKQVTEDPFTLKALCAILNSTLADFWIWFNCPEVGDDRRHMGKAYFENFPVPDLALSGPRLSQLTDQMISLNDDLQKQIARFIRRVKETYPFSKVTTVIGQFYKFSFADFVRELSKQKINLSLRQKDELEEYFSDYVKEITTLNEKIAATNREINSFVFQIYGMTEEEIKIVAARE